VTGKDEEGDEHERGALGAAKSRSMSAVVHKSSSTKAREGSVWPSELSGVIGRV